MKTVIELEHERLEWSLKIFPEATHYSSLKKLKEELEQEKQKSIRDTNYLRQQLILEENKRKESDRKLKRIHNGVCPCCNRSFVNLQRHMKTKHPEVVSVEPQKKAKRNFLENDARK